MDRHPIVPLLLLLCAFVITGCAKEPLESRALAQTPDQSTPSAAGITRVPDFISSAQLGLTGRPAGTGKPDVNQEGVGGFRCSKLHEIQLTVSSDNDEVEMNPEQEHLNVEPGDCVQWRVVANDKEPAVITKIKFADTPQDPADPKKKGSKHPTRRDFCTEKTSTCALYIALDDGTYQYQVEINHGNGKTPKIKDPDLEVACNGNPC